MASISVLRDGKIKNLKSNDAYDSIIALCNQHKVERKAFSFAFIIHNSSSPQLNKVLADEDYWESLNYISSDLLTIFYLPSSENNFAENLLYSSGEERSMYGVDVEGGQRILIPMIKSYLQYDQPIRLVVMIEKV